LPSPSESALLFALILLASRDVGAQVPSLEATVNPKDGAASLEVDLRNPSSTAAVPVTLEGELRGVYQTATLAEGVPAGGEGRIVLHFERTPSGSFPLALRLRYPSAPRGAIFEEQLLCLPLGPAPPVPMVSVSALDTSFETSTEWPVTIASADGRPHAVRVRIEVPKGLGVSPAEGLVTIGASTPGRMIPRLFRGSFPRGSKAQVWVLAEPQDAEPAAALASRTVRILPDPALFPRIRIPLLVLAAALLAAAFFVELKDRFAARRVPLPPTGEEPPEA
jgi:hypothetical protein